MNDVFLGAIAVAVVVMAAIQVAAVVVALRAARRVGDALSQLRADVQPILANLQTVSTQAARAANAAAVQVEHAGRLLNDLSRRVDDTAAAVQASIVAPAREAYALAQGVVAALATFRRGPARSPHPRGPVAEDDDPLFIG